MKKIVFLISSINSLLVFGQNTINAELNFNTLTPISTLIYGYNQNHETLNSDDNWTIRRLGGNRLTAFNWENGASNAGHDYINSSDNRIPNLMGLPDANKNLPGEVYRFFHESNLSAGVTSIITFPILGWVAADKNGAVSTGPPSNRWNELVFKKESPFTLNPDLTDGKVYLDEGFNFILHHFGNASTSTGVKYIALDNEPGLWNSTHPLLQPNSVTISDYLKKVIEAAKVIKTMDPNVKIILGEFANINIYDFNNTSDWSLLKKDYDWFPSLLLDTLKKESDKFGMPLVDIFSFHFYPQHKIDNNGEYSSNGSVVRGSLSTEEHIRETRMDFSRSLWDTTYIEPSWLTKSKLSDEPNKILLRLQKSIDTYFPSIEIMIGEYDFGFDTDISHAVTMVDFLAVCGQNKVAIANRWDLNPYNGSTYTNTALKLFRNYDGANSTYGTKAIKSSFTNPKDGSIWASLNDDESKLHLLVLNKDVNDALNFNIQTNEVGYNYTFESCYAIEPNNQNLNLVTSDKINININNTIISGTMEPLKVYHIILNRNSIITNVDNLKFQQNLILFPNPVNQFLGVQNLNMGSQIQIFDNQGKEILNTQYNGDLIDVRNLKHGMYLFKYDNQTIKFIVE